MAGSSTRDVYYMFIFGALLSSFSIAGSSGETIPIEFSGFVESRLGVRISDDPSQKECEYW